MFEEVIIRVFAVVCELVALRQSKKSGFQCSSAFIRSPGPSLSQTRSGKWPFAVHNKLIRPEDHFALKIMSV